MDTITTVTNYIEQIWNQREFNQLDNFIHPDIVDHSLPPGAANGKEGLKAWVEATGLSFEHKTIVEDIVSDVDKCVVRFHMQLKHIGRWRDFEPSGANVTTEGFRMFRLRNNRIIEHWAQINGQMIENQLKRALLAVK